MRGRLVVAASAGILVRARALDRGARDPDDARARARARRRLGLREPAARSRPAVPDDTRPAADDRPAERAAAVAPARRRRARAHRARPRRAPRLGGACPFVARSPSSVLTVDLFRANMGFNPAIPAAHAAQPGPARSAISSRQRAEPLRRARASTAPSSRCQPDLSMRYGLYDARGYDYPVEQRYDRFWRRHAAPPGDFIAADRAGHRRPRPSLRALSLLSVSDVLQDPADPPSAAARPARRLLRAATRAIYRNTARAAARLPRRRASASVAGDDAALAATIAPGLRRRAAWRSPSSRSPGSPHGRRGPPARPARARLVPLRRRARRRVDATARGASAPRAHRRRTTRAGRPPSTAARRRSSAWTTCCAASWCRPAPTASSSATSRRAGGSAGSSACWRRSRCWPSWSPSCCGDAGRGRPAP